MSENHDDMPARVGHGPTFSSIWFVPLLAFAIGIWMLYMHWAGQGPLIEITFVSGEGIEAGKSKVKRKNVEIGEVLDMRLSADTDKVVITVRIENHAAHLLREDSSFWVVRPRIGKEGISGLNTLLSGAYIELTPGTREPTAREFEGLEIAPVTPLGTPGLHVTLDSMGNRALSVGDPVLFHGMEVGKIEYVHFNSQERRAYFNAFIAAPYDRLVTTNTRFWLSNGVSFELSADGVRVEMMPLATILSGGVSFDVPEGQPLGNRIEERAFFTIYARESAIYEKLYEHSLNFVILFDESIRGLRPGAPVEYRGVKVGQVVRTDIGFAHVKNLLEPGARIPVLIKIEPARFGFADTQAGADNAEMRLNDFVANGLRGGLATGSLLTGQKYVELQFFEGDNVKVQTFASHTVIPSTSGKLGQLVSSISRTLDTLNSLPLDKVVASARKALDQTAATLAGIDEILADTSSHNVVESLNATLQSFQKLAADFSEGSATNRDLQRSLRSLELSLNELEPVLRNLRHKPNSLIFGGQQTEDLLPKGAQE